MILNVLFEKNMGIVVALT